MAIRDDDRDVVVKVTPVQQKILNAVKTLATKTKTTTSREVPVSANRSKVMAMSGYTKKNGSGFNFALSIMKTKQRLLTFDRESITLTLLGNQLAQMDPTQTPSASNDAYWNKCLSRVKGTKGKLIFQALRDGQEHTRADLAVQCGYDSCEAGGFRFAVSKLVSTTGMVEYCKNNEGQPSLRLTEDVFPYGRPAGTHV